MTDRDLERIIFPKDGFTKRNVIEYYERLSPVMLPHIQDRPLMLQRCPAGTDHECSYMPYAAAQDVESVVRLAEIDCVTPHMWLSRTSNLEKPDLMAFDLSPTGEGFREVREMALALCDVLDLLELKSFAMTTGSRGLEVVVPLDGRSGFDEVQEFGRDVAHGLADAYPDVVTLQPRQSRRNLVYVDVSRNAYGQTVVAPYSLRAKAGAPIATPLDWSELEDSRLQSNRYNLRNIYQKLDVQGDVWKDIWLDPQSLARARNTLDAWIPGQNWRAAA